MYFTRTSKLLFFIQLIVVKLEQNNDTDKSTEILDQRSMEEGLSL